MERKRIKHSIDFYCGIVAGIGVKKIHKTIYINIMIPFVYYELIMDLKTK